MMSTNISQNADPVNELRAQIQEARFGPGEIDRLEQLGELFKNGQVPYLIKLKPGGKAPTVDEKGWSAGTSGRSHVEAIEHIEENDGNIGLRLDNILVIDWDVDPEKPETLGSLSKLAKDYGLKLNHIPASATGSGDLRSHFFTRLPAGTKLRSSSIHLVEYAGIEFLSGNERYVVAPGSETDEIYVLLPSHPPFCDMPEAPQGLLAVLQRQPSSSSGEPPAGEEITPELAKELLDGIDATNYSDRDGFRTLMCAFKQATRDSAGAEDGFMAWARTDQTFDADEHEEYNRNLWDGIELDKPGGAGLGSLMRLSHEHGLTDLSGKLAAYKPLPFETIPGADDAQPAGPDLLAREKAAPTLLPDGLELGLIGEAARAIAKKVDVAVELSLQSTLAVASLATQGRVNVKIPGSAEKPVSLYLCTLADSGERKTTADDEASKEIERHEQRLRQTYESDVAEHAKQMGLYEVRKKALETRIKTDENDGEALEAHAKLKAPAASLEPLLVTGTGTIEGLADMLVKGQPSIAIMSTEGGRFIHGQGMKDEAKIAMAAGLSEVWDKGRLTPNTTKTSGRVAPFGKRVSVHLSMQPEVANKLLGDTMIFGQGILGRLLVAEAPSRIGYRTFDQPVDDPAVEVPLQRYHTRVAKILASPLPLMEGGHKGRVDPPALTMTPAAVDVWRAELQRLEPLQRQGGRFAPIRTFISKAPEHLARLAAVLAVFERGDFNALAAGRSGFQAVDGADPFATAEPAKPPDTDPFQIIEVEHVNAAIMLFRRYAEEFLRLIGQAEIPDYTRDALLLKGWLQDKYPDQPVTVRKLVTYGPTRLRTTDKINSVLKTLLRHRIITKTGDGRNTFYQLVPGQAQSLE